MSSVTVLEDDNYPRQEVGVRKETTVLESVMSSAQRRKLADISNLQGHAKQETQKQQNMMFSSQEYAEKLQKENMTLMKALAHRNKIIELSGVECQKLRINLRNVQEKNLQLAQANSQMLAELNTNKDRLKLLQHELGCNTVLLKVRKMQHEEQALPCTNHASKVKIPENVSDGDCAHGMNHKDTKRKRTSRIKRSSNVKPIHVNENANSKRKVSGIIDTTGITEETCQTEDAVENGVVSQGVNQIGDNVVNKKFVLDAANPVKDSLHSKRQCTRRQSTRFDVQETEEIDKLLEMDGAKETQEIARPSLRRRSARFRTDEAEPSKSFHEIDEAQCLQQNNQTKETEQMEKLIEMDGTKETARPSLKRRASRLRPEEGEPCKSFHEIDEVRETIKSRRISSRQQPARFDFQELEVPDTLNADDAGSLVSKETTGSRSEAVEPSENRHDAKETNGKRRVSTRRQSTKGKSQTSTETDATVKEIATDLPLRNTIVLECDLKPPSVSQEDNERESKNNKPIADETEGMMRRTSVGRPSRHAAEKVQSYKEVSLKVKMRRK
ncbi:hypothetical protein AALP_AA8G036900 [Arabis alpina]|uniref:Shugoshin C-terminal domain-containing protein n=1 Tax=Arabis alpina TaxID=50452 RepID=A0A087G4S9_ARAAL|nr:hypothetical protein AALP_AA8G036900 [Arabis alpina]